RPLSRRTAPARALWREPAGHFTPRPSNRYASARCEVQAWRRRALAWADRELGRNALGASLLAAGGAGYRYRAAPPAGSGNHIVRRGDSPHATGVDAGQ